MPVASIRTRLTRSILLLAACNLAACQAGSGQEPATASQQAAPAADFARFVSFFPGLYRNGRQVAEQVKATERPGFKRNDDLTLRMCEVQLPAFGKHPIYAEWTDASDGRLVRQRIYGLEQVGSEFVVRLHIFPVDEEFRARTQGACSDPAKLADLELSDMVKLDGCDIFLKPNGAGFAGSMRRRECVINAPDLVAQPVYSWTQMRIADGRFAYLDGWYDFDDTLVDQSARDWYMFERQ